LPIIILAVVPQTTQLPCAAPHAPSGAQGGG
jgi:hypothetical protein